MSDQATKMIESCEMKEKPHNLDKNQITSYLSLLEKIYNKENCDKFHQERIFRITKALNSIKKYSNFKVSPFRLNKSSIPKEEQKVQNEKEKEAENNTIKENEDEQKDIEDIMCMIEKELKLNGIDTTDIANDSYISTYVKSQNSNSVPNTQMKDSPLLSTQNKNTQKRLSKLFLKIEMKLKTYLQSEQENDSKPKLVTKENQKCDNINNNNDLNNKSNVDNNNKINMSKRPSKLPELENSFFSNKKKVEMMLARAKKWKRKSMVEFKALQFSKLKNDCDIGVIFVKDNKNNNQLRPKAMPCTALLKKPKKKKNPKNTNDKIVSAFSYAKIDEKEEDMAENEEEINFEKINENQNEEEEKVDEGKMISQLPNFIDDKNAASIKITSTINKNKFDIDEMHKERKKEISLYESKPCFYIVSDHNICDYSEVDKNISSSSSSDDDSSSDSISEDEKENSASSKSKGTEEKKEEESSQKSEESEKSNNSESNNDSNNNSKSSNGSKKASNFKYFYRHSIFSPFSGVENSPERHDKIIEKFSNMNL